MQFAALEPRLDGLPYNGMISATTCGRELLAPSETGDKR